MCVREIEAAKGHLTDLVLRYRKGRKEAEEQGITATDAEHCMALAHDVNAGVTEHYGVVNGQIVAVAVHQIATAMGELHVMIDADAVKLAVMAANEKLRDGNSAPISDEQAHTLLTAITQLQH
jgi:hypothetical protein